MEDVEDDIDGAYGDAIDSSKVDEFIKPFLLIFLLLLLLTLT